MFLGRERELELLEKCYASGQFEFLILYGRRRVGKTALLQEFAGRHGCLFYSGKEKNDALNIQDFARTAGRYFGDEYVKGMAEWEDLFSYIGSKAGKERTVLIIDEFPFIAEGNPAIKSVLQHMIDLKWKQKNIFLILCGSSISFMENDVMGYKSPLYGRITAQLFLRPFDYWESAAFFPAYSPEEKLICFGILGGTPRYLQAFRDDRTIRDNLRAQILGNGSFLKEEPMNLLKMELREPVIYNSILEAIASGASRLNDISQKIHEDSSKCSKYVDTLRKLHIVEKAIPCGEKENSKRSIYKISDHYFLFWYRYLFSNMDYYELLGAERAADEILADLSNYMGMVFEDICMQYMKRKAKEGGLPFVPHEIGRWWGTNPKSRKQDDIDILCLDKGREKAIFCECKFRNELFDLSEYRDFMNATEIFAQPTERHYYIFVKSGFTDAVKRQAEADGVQLLQIDGLYSFQPE